MTERIVIQPVTRIEGHAKISIYIDDAGEVSTAQFHVTEFRGFEKLCEGRPFHEMPGLMMESRLPEKSPRLKGRDACAAFRFIARQLDQSNLAAVVDVFAVERCAEALALCWKADRRLRREGEIRRIPVFFGVGRARKIVAYRQQRNRWLGVRLDAEKTFARFAGALGVCGAHSRAGLEVEPTSLAAHDQLWKLLRSPRLPRIPPATPPDSKPV
jgi:hypothetical protein